jgi:putative nucleotidyltransferase with HDIG domain/PAS domain S-box-containing protein
MENSPAPSEEASNVESTLRYKQLFEGAVDGILILSYPDGEIKDLNPAAIELLGYDRGDLIGTCFWESALIHQSNKGYDMYATLLKYGEANYPELLLITKSGSTIPIHFSAEVYRLDHKSIIQCNLHNAMEVHDLKKIIHNHAISSQKAIHELIHVLVSMVQFRDPYTANHQVRVSHLGEAIAREMQLTENEINGIKASALVHDIGKIAIPSEILTKSSALNAYEMALVQNHVVVGYQLLKNLEFPWNVAKIVLQHHERLDGSGYPNHLKGDEICLEAQIVAVADTVEAMAHFRPYRPALGIDAALHAIDIDTEFKYSSAVVDSCIRLFREKQYAFPDLS